MLAQTKAYQDILSDPLLSQEWQQIALPQLLDIFAELILAGTAAGVATLGRATKQSPFELYGEDLGVEAAEALVRETSEWWLRFSDTTRRQLAEALAAADVAGLPPAAAAASLESIFGRARARLIAETETTRLFNAGALASYRAVGVTEWEWHTVMDTRVDPVCQDLQGTRYPISREFEPQHPRCRCYAVPVEVPLPT